MANTNPPTISITANRSLLKAGDTALISFTLSELATDFLLSDITVTGGTLSNFSGSGMVYSARFTPTQNSTAQGLVCVGNFKFSDIAGNANEDGADPNNRVYFVIDTLAPTISISASKINLGINESPTITFSLSEPSTDFDLSDISVSGGTLSSFKGSGTSYSAVLTPTSTNDIFISVSAYSFTDHSGNANTGSAEIRFPYDTSRANVSWTRLIGTSSSETANALTIGKDGSIYVGGNTTSTLNGPLYSGNGDGFVTKYKPDGTKVWANLLATNREESVSAIATGIDGSIYVSGSTNGSLDMEVNSGSYDAFVVKYNPDGTKVWTRLMGNGGGTFAKALAVDFDGAIYVGGSASGRLPLDGQWFDRGEGDAFISKYNQDGTKAWTRGLGTSRYDSINAITIGLDGSIYASGETGGSVDGQPFNSGHFLTKFSTDGTKVWTRMLGSSLGLGLSNFPNSITTGLDGFIYICGYTDSSMDQQPSSKGRDAFLTKYSTDGSKIWTILIASDKSDLAYALATGLDGSIYVSGTTEGALDGQTALGSNDIFVTKYRPDGTKVWTLQTGTTTYDFAYALTTGLDESIYVSGATYGPLDGSVNNGDSDAFVFKLSIPDTSAPQIHISSKKTSINIGESSSLTFTLSKPSSNFVMSDISAQGGTISNFQGSAASYTAIFTASTDGINGASISVGNGKFSDALGIFNEDGADANNKVTFTVTLPADTTPPSISVTANATSLIAGDTTTLTFTLSEASSNFAVGDVSVSGGTLSNFTGSGASYSALFTPAANSTNNGVVSIPSGVFSDAAGNANADGLDTNNKISLAVDTTLPSISVTANATSLIAGDTTTLTFTLSEASSNFAVGDVSVSGGTLSNFTGSGTTYSVLFTPAANSTNNGVVGIASGVFSDAAGNANADGSDTNNKISLAVDTTLPSISVTANATSLIAGDTTTLTFNLSEASSNFAVGDVAVSGGTLSNFTGSGASYSVLFTPLANSTNNGVVSIPSGVFSDAAGNANADGLDTNNLLVFSIDTQLPTISVSSNKSSLQGGDSATLIFNLSEPSNNFTVADISFTGGTLSNFTGSGTSYTSNFTLMSVFKWFETDGLVS